MAADRVLLLGESGSGKSTSLESLNPKETFIINVASKSLPIRGWRSKYTEFSKDNPTGNLSNVSKSIDIIGGMNYVNSKRPEIKNLIIDDLFYMAAFELFDKLSETGYNKFTSIANAFKQVATLPLTFRSDLTVFYFTHPEESVDIDGKRVIKVKVCGKMIENQLNFEGLFDKVLYARPRKSKEKGIEYGFETQTDTTTPAKTPRGLFTESFIPNDLAYVKKAIAEYEK